MCNTERKKYLENESVELLSKILIVEIMNRMSSYCNQCENYYLAKIVDAEPKIRCMRCKIGSHACNDINIDNKILSEAGLYWFCDECNQQFMSEYINKLDKNAHFKGFKENYENEKEKETKTRKQKKTLPQN